MVANTWAPYVDETLPENGLAIHIVTEAFEKVGYQTTLTIESWPRTLEGVQIGIYDVIAAAWRTPERMAKFDFSKPYVINDIKFVTLRGNTFTYRDLSSLTGLRVGVVHRFAYSDTFDEATNFIKVPQNHVIQNLLKLMQGEIDLTLGDELTIQYAIDQFLSVSADKFRFVPNPLSQRGLRIAVSRQNPDHERIVDEFNSALDAMKEDGSLKRLTNTHFTSGSSTP